MIKKKGTPKERLEKLKSIGFDIQGIKIVEFE
jgi:hypothetical protein